MVTELFDEDERAALCDCLEELGANAPTLLGEWSAHDLAAHLVLRDHDPLAGPCLVLPGPFARFAERRRAALAHERDFPWLVDGIRSGSRRGFFRLRWVRAYPTLNELFVHHEDLRRANGLGPRTDLPPALERALWRNAVRSSRYLSRRVRGLGLELRWPGTDEVRTLRRRADVVQLAGPPGELLLFLFGRQAAAQVEVTGPQPAVQRVLSAHFGM